MALPVPGFAAFAFAYESSMLHIGSYALVGQWPLHLFVVLRMADVGFLFPPHNSHRRPVFEVAGNTQQTRAPGRYPASGAPGTRVPVGYICAKVSDRYLGLQVPDGHLGSGPPGGTCNPRYLPGALVQIYPTGIWVPGPLEAPATQGTCRVN